MKLIVGKNNVSKARSSVADAQIVHETDEVLVLSTSRYMAVAMSSSRTLFVWGEIYSIRQSNGYFRQLDMIAEPSVLRDLFEQFDLTQALNRIEGNFTGMLIDIDKEEVTIFCDTLNRSEVFYTRLSDGVVAATNLKPVLESLDTIEYSQVALANMLSIYGCSAPKKLTLYKNVYRLGVGERIEFNKTGVEIRRTEFVPTPCREYEDREHHEYAEIFRDSIRIRASSRMNWVFLSSGWDSTAILTILVREYGRSRVRGVIGQMNYSDRAGTVNQFELDRANKFAEYFGIQLDVVPLDLREQEAIDYWKSIAPGLREQHIYAISSYNFYRLSDHIRKHGDQNDAIFAGEISDGVHNFGFSQFATILDHPDLGFREYSDKMASYLFGPTFFKSVVKGTYGQDGVYKFLRARLGEAEFDDTSATNESDRRKKYFLSFFNRNVRLPFYSKENTKILTAQGSSILEQEVYEMYLKEAAENATPETLYSWLLHLYNSFHWQGGTVRCFGSRLAEWGQKIKLPFWDGRLHGFLSAMPEDWGRGLELKPAKYPLKWALANKFDYPMHFQTGPHSYIYDVNPQFSHIGEMLFGSFLSSHLKEILKDYPYEKILDKTYFNLPYMRSLVDNYRNGAEFSGQERTDLMAIVTLCLVGWY